MSVTGIVKIKINGSTQLSKEGAKLTFGGMERSPVMWAGGLAGFVEKPQPATITCTIVHRADTDTDALNDLKNATVEFECDTGVTYVVTEAFRSKLLELAGGEGDLTLEIIGNAAKKGA